MTNKVPDSESEHDGNWFLEAVGATPPAPTGSEAIDELTKENDIAPPAESEVGSTERGEGVTGGDSETPAEVIGNGQTPSADQSAPATRQMLQTTQVTVSSFDGSPGTTNAAFAPTAARKAPTTPAPPPLPDDSPVDDAIDATDPVAPAAATVVQPIDEELARPLRSSRSFRWPVIVVLVLMIIAVGVAAIFLPRAAEAEALAVRQTYYDVTSDVRSYIPEAQTALDAITDETSDIAELSAAIPRIAELDSLAFSMQDAAAEPLPSTLPLVQTGAIDALVPLQDSTGSLGDDGSDLANRLGNAYIYRVSIPGLMQTGSLPTAATTETINEISSILATSLADDAAVVSQLPGDEIFSDVHALAFDSHNRYGPWQMEYLAALTNEDRDAAEVLIKEIDETRAGLAEANTEALAAFRSVFDTYIVEYARQLEAHMNNLTLG